MSVTYGFYNSVKGDKKYDAIEFARMLDGVVTDGIFETIGDKFNVSAGTGMKVNVGSGRAWLNHTWTLNDSTLVITIDKSEQVLKRIDTVVIDVDVLNRVNDIIVVKGTPASSPVAPTLINDSDSEHYQYPLCDIYVAAGVIEITQSNITPRIGTGIGTDTPFAIGTVQPVTTVKMIWKNENQTAAFPAQHINFDSSIKYQEVYDALYVRCRLNSGNGYEVNVLITSPLGNICQIPPMDLWGVSIRGIYVRGFIWKDASVQVGACTCATIIDSNNAFTLANDYAIPIAIYGIKWGRFTS